MQSSAAKAFVKKILGTPEGNIVSRTPDIVLTNGDTASIRKTFENNDHQAVRDFVKKQRIARFYDAGTGICHQLMAYHARPGMIITRSDSDSKKRLVNWLKDA